MNFGYISLAYLSLMVLSFLDNGRGASYPLIIENFDLSANSASLIFSLASLSGLFVNFTTSRWLPRFGLIKSNKFFLLLMGLSGLLYGLSSILDSYSYILLGAILGGIGFGGIGITMNIMVSEGAPINKRRRYLSGLHGVYGTASFLAPLIFNFVLSVTGNWNYFFVLSALLSFVVMYTSRNVEDSHLESVKSSYISSSTPKSIKLFVGLFMGLYVTSEILISTRLTIFLTTFMEMKLAEANTYLSFFFLFLLIGRLTFAFIHFNTSSYKLLLSSLVTTFLLFSLGIKYHPIFFSACGLTLSFFFPVAIEWINEKFGKDSHSMISSSMTYIGLILVFMHQFFGVVTEKWGIEKAFYCFYIFNLLSLIFLMLSMSKVSKQTKQL